MITDHERAKLAEADVAALTARMEQGEALLRAAVEMLDGGIDTGNEALAADVAALVARVRAHLATTPPPEPETPFAAGLRKTLAINRGQSDEVLARGVRGYLDLAAVQPLATCAEHGAPGCAFPGCGAANLSQPSTLGKEGGGSLVSEAPTPPCEPGDCERCDAARPASPGEGAPTGPSPVELIHATVGYTALGCRRWITSTSSSQEHSEVCMAIQGVVIAALATPLQGKRP